jgi:membrane fusion protein, multidrug efflux system
MMHNSIKPKLNDLNSMFWVILVTVFLNACEPVEEPQASIETIRPVKTMVVTAPPIETRRRHPGKVQAYQRAELAFNVPGTLIELPIKEGQEVKKNTLLAHLDPRDYKTRLAKVESAIAEARAQLKAMKAGARPEDVRVLTAELSAAKARFQEAKQQYLRYKDLWSKRVVSKADYDRQESAYNVARAQLNTAQQNLLKGKMGARREDIEAMESNIQGLIAQRDEAQNALDDTYLKAPFDGVIAKKFVENYQNIKAKEPILILQDISRLDIVVNVPEQLIIHAKEPEFYQFAAIFDSVPNEKFALKIKEYSTEADPKTQTYRGVFTMKAPKNIKIWPGMTATLIATEPNTTAISSSPTLLIPTHAVFTNELNQQFVWLVNTSNMKVQKNPVQVGELTGESIQITHGLTAGERIVIAGVHFLQEGITIRLLDNNGY